MPRDRRQLRITWSQELLEDFFRHHDSVNPHGSASDTLREIVQAQLASDPAGTLHRAARQTAFKESVRIANKVVRDALFRAREDFTAQMPEEL